MNEINCKNLTSPPMYMFKSIVYKAWTLKYVKKKKMWIKNIIIDIGKWYTKEMFY